MANFYASYPFVGGGGGVGTGTVTSVSVASANGLAGTVATATTTPVITLSTTATGVLKGNGTSISAAAAGTDYQAPITVGNLTDAGTDGITVTGGSGAVIGGGTSIAQAAATASQNGYLKSSDWSTFNGKGSGTVTAVSVVSANGFAGTSGGGATPALTLTTSVNGLAKGNGTALSAATSGTDYSAGTAALATGIVKSTTATGALTIAAAGTDYAPATSGSALLKGNGAGGFSAAVSATDYAPATTGSSILKASSGGFASAISGTDYAPATSGSSILKASSGGFANAVAGTDYQAADAQLSSLIRQNSQSAAYTTVLTDSGKHIYHPSADTTARTFTIDSNANVAYSIGTALTFVNDTSGGVITIAITGDTLILAGAGTTGSRTLAANGIATALKIGTTRWMISGTGLT
jgi:hypothetical protein